METKYITIPFDLERAKRITNKSEDGKIVTRDGRKARIVCFDVKNEDSILALIEDEKGIEFPICYVSDGLVFLKSKSNSDLMLSVPEWTTFKDGDTIAFDNVKDVFFIIGSGCSITDKHPHYYVKYEKGWITFGTEDSFCMIENSRLATDTEKQKLINELNKSKEPLAKEYLKRFFPNHSNPSNIGKEYNFEPGQPVIGIDGRGEWRYDIFSHYKPEHKNGNYVCSGRSYSKCLPYNDQTKHLVGTTDNWEE